MIPIEFDSRLSGAKVIYFIRANKITGAIKFLQIVADIVWQLNDFFKHISGLCRSKI